MLYTTVVNAFHMKCTFMLLDSAVLTPEVLYRMYEAMFSECVLNITGKKFCVSGENTVNGDDPDAPHSTFSQSSKEVREC
jgi:hypothetical protein